jgi:hypothetical protein
MQQALAILKRGVMAFQSQPLINPLMTHDRRPTVDLYTESCAIIERMSGRLERRLAPRGVVDALNQAIPSLLPTPDCGQATHQDIRQIVDARAAEFVECMKIDQSRQSFFSLLKD